MSKSRKLSPETALLRKAVEAQIHYVLSLRHDASDYPLFAGIEAIAADAAWLALDAAAKNWKKKARENNHV